MTSSTTGTSSATRPASQSTSASGNTASTLRTAKRMAKQMLPLINVEFRAIACGTAGHLFSVWSVMCAAASIILGFTQHTPLWIPLAVAAIIMALLRGPLAYGEQLFNHQMAFSTLRDIRISVFDTMRRLAPAKLKEQGRGNLVTVITEDIELLEIFYAHTLSPIAIATITALVNTVVLAVLNPWLGLTALVFYILIALVVPLLSAKPTYRAAFAERQAQGELHSLVLESLDGREELLAMGASSTTQARLRSATERMLDARTRNQRAAGWNGLATESIPLIAIMVFVTVSSWLATTGQASTLTAIVAIAGFLTSFPALISVARLGSGLQPTMAAARRVFALFDETPAVEETEDGSDLKGFDALEATSLAFRYPHARHTTLSDVNLRIVPGDTIGIQGENGAGKSTLIDVLMRFRERSSGDLSVSGVSIEAVNTHSLRSQESMVSQDTFIFSTSLAENIAVSKPDASREQIEAAAHKACLDEVIAELPGGLDHVLERNGDELSEGQKQRIAVARAFLSEAPLVLFDEPTSNMDALLEGQVMRALLDQQTDSAFVVVSHRPAVLAYMKQVLTLDHGRLSPTR